MARDRDKYERELVQSRKRLETLVAEATRHQAEAKDRALFAEQMVGIVSHDLRNPLSAIAMATALLVRGELSESQQRTANRIGRATERATRLIADLLDFTQARLGRLAQLLGNLVSNAVTHGDPDRPVTVTSSIDARSFTIAVHNWGAPIPLEAQANIFQAMTRGKHPPAAGRSVGRGLFIVSEIAKAHGGCAEVESTLDKGTTFRAVFPATEP